MLRRQLSSDADDMLQTILDLLSIVIRSLTPVGRKRLIAENLALRQQLIVLKRGNKRCPNLTPVDRTLFAVLSGLIPQHRLERIAIIPSPQTLLGFHKALVTKQYQKLFGAKNKRKPDRKPLNQELINAIVTMKMKNPRFGTVDFPEFTRHFLA